jgi:hypothetical protein
MEVPGVRSSCTLVAVKQLQLQWGKRMWWGLVAWLAGCLVSWTLPTEKAYHSFLFCVHILHFQTCIHFSSISFPCNLYDYEIAYENMRFQVLTAASMKFRFVFWDVLPCKIIVNRRFRGTCCLHHQGSTYLWNVGQQLFYMALHPRSQNLNFSLWKCHILFYRPSIFKERL